LYVQFHRTGAYTTHGGVEEREKMRNWKKPPDEDLVGFIIIIHIFYVYTLYFYTVKSKELNTNTHV
jgi:hypothetical protein